MTTILAACQSTQPAATIDAAFDEKEAAYIHKQGETRIDGHAFIKTPNGTAKHAVGEPVRLIPPPAYARERYKSF